MNRLMKLRYPIALYAIGYIIFEITAPPGAETHWTGFIREFALGWGGAVLLYKATKSPKKFTDRCKWAGLDFSKESTMNRLMKLRYPIALYAIGYIIFEITAPPGAETH